MTFSHSHLQGASSMIASSKSTPRFNSLVLASPFLQIGIKPCLGHIRYTTIREVEKRP